MSDQADLDTELTAVETSESQDATDIKAALNDLVAKLSAAGNPIDLSAEVGRLTALADNLNTVDEEAKADDPSVEAPVDETSTLSDPKADDSTPTA